MIYICKVRALLLGGAVAALVACSTGGSTSAPSARRPQPPSSLVRRAPSTSGFVYVTNEIKYTPPAIGSVNYYPVGSNGDVMPSGVIEGSNTQLTLSLGVAVDPTGEIYVANGDTNSIVGFAPGSNGNVSPNVMIAGANTGLATPTGLALDRAGNLYVDNCGTVCNYGPPGPTSVKEFAAGSNGNVAPLRTISGSLTLLGQTDGIAVDRKGNIFVTNAAQQTVTVYGPRAHGNVSPLRVIAGANTRLNDPAGIAVDDNNLYVAPYYQEYIERFARLGGGNVPPRSVLDLSWPSGGPSGGVVSGLTIAPDGTLYATGVAGLIAQFAPKAKGHAAPLTMVQGPHTQLVLPAYVFVR
jgi:hypothetical protein